MNILDYLNENYPVRKSESEKEGFRTYVTETLAKQGIEAHVEKTSDGKNNNIVIGDPCEAEVIYTAHYDTPASSPMPNVMMPLNRVLYFAYQFVPVILLLAFSLGLSYLIGMVFLNDFYAYFALFMILYYGSFFVLFKGFKNPHNHNDNTSGVAVVLSIIEKLSDDERKRCAFILFDNEEKGKKGSAAYFKDHKEKLKQRLLINFDCVGDGKNIVFIAQKGARDSARYSLLKQVFGSDDGYDLIFTDSKHGDSNSDHKNFPCGIACVACNKTRGGILYTSRIHTPRDTFASAENIEFLSRNICEFTKKL